MTAPAPTPTPTPTKRAWATIDSDALKKNLAQVRSLCPESAIFPVIKANAYGHGMANAARAFADSHTKIAGFAISTMAEALELKQLGIDQPILLLNGFINTEELSLCLEQGIEPVVHSSYQVELLEQRFSKEIFGEKRKLWLKFNSGMNRLGMSAEQCLEAYLNLHKYPDTEFVLMSHFAYADDLEHSASRDFTDKQMQAYTALAEQMQLAKQDKLECSLAASAGILCLPESHLQIVRPGVMLYGSSPLNLQTGEDLGLSPAMTLHSRLIAINEVPAGGSIGYGATYVCDKDTRVGVVSIGYGDGYPRSAVNGTPVLIKTGGATLRTRLIGRVSMDMITIDLSGLEDARIDDEVILWGEGLCADEVAQCANTIAYELFCKVTKRVEIEYL